MPKKLILARPGHQPAARAVAAYHRRRDGVLPFAGGGFMFMFFMMMVLSKSTIVVGVAAAGMLVLAGVSVVNFLPELGDRIIPSRRTYRKLLASGDIIKVDPYLVEVWDTLRAEEQVTLTEAERAEQLPLLFSAAEDLCEELRRRRSYRDEPEKVEALLLSEARIRARVLRDVCILGQGIETRRQLELLNPTINPGWASDEEVDAQLQLLRERRADNSDNHDADNSASGKSAGVGRGKDKK